MASPSNRATKWFVWILFFCHFLLGSTCRIGEAKTPGPPAHDSGDWSFGVCNPSGLHGKAMLVSGIKADIIAVSETHHTSVSKSMFQRSLKATVPTSMWSQELRCHPDRRGVMLGPIQVLRSSPQSLLEHFARNGHPTFLKQAEFRSQAH